MSNRWFSLLALTALLTGLLIGGALPAGASRPIPVPTDHEPAFVPGEVVVGFAPGLSAQQRQTVLDSRNLRVLRDLDKLDASVIETPAGAEEATAAALRDLAGVAYAELNYLAQAFGTPNDPSFGQQWNMRKINGPAAWDVTPGSADTVVAIVDTGIDLEHPDLQAKIVAGYDFVNNDDVAQDDHGHGTHCAGIAGAISNNAVGVAGVNWQTRLMPVKVLNDAGSGFYSAVAAGIVWAADHGATVISLSLGGSAASTTLSAAVNYAYTQGVVIVAAAGNGYTSGNAPTYPAALPNVIGVAATTTTDTHAYYSNTGAYVDIAAPGGDSSGLILSTLWTSGGHSYGSLAGTSMATPHVAGLVALLRGIAPALTPAEVATLIQSSAVDLGAAGRDDVFGWGRIDVLAAVQAASSPAPTATPTSTSTATPLPQPTATSTSTPLLTATSTVTPQPTSTSTPATAYLVRVNAGGVRYTDRGGRVWLSDRPYTAGSWGYVGGIVRATTSHLPNTLDDPLYRSDRNWSSGGLPGYRFGVPDGSYEVTLRFAETYWNAANKREFSVGLEGVIRLSNYDIFAAAGGKNRAAPDQVFVVDVADGELTIDFVRILDMPKVNAIQVRRIL